MAEQSPATCSSDALDRIDRALDRIEAATTARVQSSEAITRRHAILRTRVADAVAALDDVIAQGTD